MFINVLLSAFSNHILNWLVHQETKFHDWLQALALQMAVSRAFQTFAENHPRWAASLFDEYFLRGQAAPLLARYTQPADRPTATELANAWFDQLGSMKPSSTAGRVTDVIEVATDFLGTLDAELCRLGA